jgi:hypothetical protein
VNIDIPRFEGKIYDETLKSWLQWLGTYFVVNYFSDEDKFAFVELKAVLVALN